MALTDAELHALAKRIIANPWEINIVGLENKELAGWALRLHAEVEQLRDVYESQGDDIRRLEQERDELTEQSNELRRVLWLNHHRGGYTPALYGDDGEMQCNTVHQNGDGHVIGFLDFKRQSLPFLVSAVCSLLRFQEERAEKAEAELAALREGLSKLQRFRTVSEVGYVVPSDTGAWVKWSDIAARLEKK